MTTLKDLLNDFAEEIAKNAKQYTTRDTVDGITEEESKNDILDDYIMTIKERLVG